MQIHFCEVKDGEKFTTPNSKRLLTAVKVGPTNIKGCVRNAVILLDHAGMPAQDLGDIITIHSHESVEVSRQ